MPSYVPCKKNDPNGYIFYVSLVSQADTKLMQANPTLAAGDVKIAIDDGAPNNLGTLPAVDADFTKRVKVILSQAETNGDNLTIIFSDAAGAEWCDLTINIQTSAQTFDVVLDVAVSTRAAPGAQMALTAAEETAVQGKIINDATPFPGADIALIKAKTDNLPANPASQTNLDVAVSTRETPAHVTLLANALSLQIGDLITRVKGLDEIYDSVALTALEATLTTMKQKVAGIFDRETDSLEAIRDRGDVAWVTGGAAPTVGQIADAVWDEIKAGHIVPGSYGVLLALEATLTAMKGVGWTNETLKYIKELVDALQKATFTL
jgi:hypothetical protein